MTLSIASNRKFGVEIEFVGISISAAERALTQAGFSLENSGYYNHNDNTNGAWKVVSDSTVDNGGEVVSPILSGIEGLEAVKKAADAINAAGATSNRSCGLHVHVDARDLNGRDLAAVVTRYGKFESTIDDVMPRSRRGATPEYCSSVISMGRDMGRWLAQPGRLDCSARDAVRQFGTDRYYKLNLLAFSQHGSIEFRQHSGTVQSGKILPWIQFCVNFVEKSRINMVADPTSPTAVVTVAGVRLGRARDSKTLVALHKIVMRLQTVGFTGVDQFQLADTLDGVSPASVVVYISNLRTQYGFDIKKRNGAYILRRSGDLPALQGGQTVTETTATATAAAVNIVSDRDRRRNVVAESSYDPGCLCEMCDGVRARRAAATAPTTAVPAAAGSRRRSSRATLVAEVVENDDAFRGLPAAVCSYFLERSSELAA